MSPGDQKSDFRPLGDGESNHVSLFVSLLLFYWCVPNPGYLGAAGGYTLLYHWGKLEVHPGFDKRGGTNLGKTLQLYSRVHVAGSGACFSPRWNFWKSLLQMPSDLTNFRLPNFLKTLVNRTKCNLSVPADYQHLFRKCHEEKVHMQQGRIYDPSPLPWTAEQLLFPVRYEWFLRELWWFLRTVAPLTCEDKVLDVSGLPLLQHEPQPPGLYPNLPCCYVISLHSRTGSTGWEAAGSASDF